MATKVQVTGTLLGSLGLRDNTVTATLCDLDGTPRIGFVPDAESELVGKESTRTNVDGSWTLSLYGNADIDSDYGDTIYRITEGPGFNQFGSNAFYIGVPTNGGPYWVADLRVTPPGGAAPESFAVVSVDGMTGVVDLNSRYVNTAGDTMTGALVLSGNPSIGLHAATKQYVDNLSGSLTGGPFMPLSGGTLTGALTLSGAPTVALHAATKQYVDDETTRATAAEALLAPKASPSFTGTVTVGGLLSLSAGQRMVSFASATDALLYSTFINSESVDRFQIKSEGALYWGSGAATPDTKLYRSAANTLKTDDSFIVDGDLTVTGTTTGVTKSMVGLGSVDNTADTAKPVSTAQQTALNLKANLASPTFTGTVNAAAITTTGNVSVGGSLSVTGIGQKQFVRATADQAIAASARVDSTFLVLPVVANAKYIMRVWIIYNNTGGTFSPSWTGPASATMKWNDTTTSTDHSIAIGSTNNTFALNASTARSSFFEGLLQTAGTAGNLTLTAAVTAGTLNILTDSYLTLERVA
ncbi:hypothetical protein [Streptomyces sp. LARHCF252]